MESNLNCEHQLVPILWIKGNCECLSCMYEWEAIWDLGMEPFNCPKCNSNDTDRTRE